MTLLLKSLPPRNLLPSGESEPAFGGPPYLVTGLDIHRMRRLIAFVGAGGKTSLMFALARQLRILGRRIITTTTTKIRFPSLEQSTNVRIAPLQRIRSSPVITGGHVTIGARVCEGKLQGYSPKEINEIIHEADHILVEADGAAGRPVKAPERWEPVIPTKADLVIVVVGLDCLGRPADSLTAHRLDRFLELTRLQRGEPITPEGLSRLLTHPMGGFKNAPQCAAVSVFLNKCDTVDFAQATALVKNLRHVDHRPFARIMLGSVREGWAQLIR